jgi:hypothetical protein
MLKKTLSEEEPQIKVPRVAPLEGASTYAPAGAYVSMHGFTPAARRIHVWREPYVSAYCSGRDAGGHDADERRLNAMSEEIIGAAFEVSNVLGAGFLEKVYENALNVELNFSKPKVEIKRIVNGV